MTLPTAPSRTMSQDTFDSTTDAFIGALPQFETDMNALAAAMALNATTDTSATSNSIGTGAKTFTVSASKSFWPGMWLVIADTAAPTTNAMFCQVTSYSGTTLVVYSYSVIGSGTKTAWQISQSAPASLDGLYPRAGYATVASATTPDIFGASATYINLTGTTPITGFVAAQYVGQEVILICAAAAVITAGANVLIEGVTSGQNLTCAAGVQVKVVATTLTQFRLTFTPVSGATTPTVTSGSGTLTTASGTLTYTRIKDRCFFNASCTITTNGTGASSISFTLPFTHASVETSSFVGRETAVTGNQLWGYISAGASLANIVNLNSGTYPAVDGYVLRVSGSFPIA